MLSWQNIVRLLLFVLCGAAAVSVSAEGCSLPTRPYTESGKIILKPKSAYCPLHEAARANNAAEIERLVRGGVDVNAQMKDGWTPLHWAAHHGKIESVSVLIDLGANVKIENKWGKPPLHVVDFSSHMRTIGKGDSSGVVRLLVEAGADINYTTKPREFTTSRGTKSTLSFGGGSIMHSAARAGDIDAINTLNSLSETLVNRTDRNGNTPLHSAIGSPIATFIKTDEFVSTVVATLTRIGVPVNKDNNKGETPLHYAAGGYKLNTVIELIKAGANVNLRNKEGKTARDLVVEKKGEADTIAIFLEEVSKKQEQENRRKAEEALKQLE